MNPNVWIALTALAMASLVHVIAVVVWLTRLDMRMKAAETVIGDLKGIDVRLARIGDAVERLEADIRKVGEGLEWIRNVSEYRPGVQVTGK